MRLALSAVTSLILCSCTGGESLFVDLRTDLVSGEEFFAVETSLDGAQRVDRPAIGSQDFLPGLRVAEFEGIDAGQHVVTVRLLDADGTEVASRRARVEVEGRLALTVLVSRDCQTITCGLEDTCVGGTCISVDCNEELNPAACGTPECSNAADCPAPPASCATATCELGACLAAPIDGACGTEEYCDVDVGCRMRDGPRDAAVDAPPDVPDSAGPDTGAPCGDFSGLLAYWPMDDADIVGTEVLDRSGNGHHGQLMGGTLPVVAPGRLGEALDWAGTTNAFVEMPTDIALDTTEDGFNTVSMWYRRDELGVSEGEVPFYIPFDPALAPPRYGIWLNSNRIAQPVLCIASASGDCWGTSEPMLLDRWVHVVVVFANGLTTNGTMYVDGSPVTVSCLIGSCTHSRTAGFPLRLGGDDPSYDWHGLIDDVRLYDRALTESEAAELFACGD